MKPWLLRLMLTISVCAAGCSSGDDGGGGLDRSEDPAEGDGTSGGASSGSGPAGDATGSSGSSAELPPGVCEERELKSERATPDILIMLDRSFSMQLSARWSPSVAAVERLTQAFDSSLRLGLMVFPGSAGSTASPCAPGQVVVPVGLDSAGPTKDALSALSPAGLTPIAESLEVAHETLAGLDGANQRYAVLVTDGAPTCVDGMLDGSPFSFSAEALMRSQAQLEAMAADGIKTYVVGLGTSAFAKQLDELAAAGGTGAHTEVDKPEDLVKELEQITGRTLSCNFMLKEAPADPSYVEVTVDGTSLKLGGADGFDLAPAATQIIINGAACDTLRAAGDHELKVQVRCSVVHVD